MKHDVGAQSAAAEDLKFSIPLAPDQIDLIHIELEKILSGRAFVQSPRHSRFLQFVVTKGLEGQANLLKEYVLGVEVFDRGASFDPRTDSIVRTEASRLRSKLKEYYETEGENDPVVIEFAKGSYCPQFRRRDHAGRSASRRR